MLAIDDAPALQVAANLAISGKHLDLLAATIAAGLNPREKYHPDFIGIFYENPLEQALAMSWDEGILLMIKTN